MPEYREDFWEELERLEKKRKEAQEAHDQAMHALFASRNSRDIAPAEAFDEYGMRVTVFDEASFSEDIRPTDKNRYSVPDAEKFGAVPHG